MGYATLTHPTQLKLYGLDIKNAKPRRKVKIAGPSALARISTGHAMICLTSQICLHSAWLEPLRTKNPLRENFDLRSDFKPIWVVQPLAQKYFTVAVGQISAISSRHLIPQEGRIAIVTNAGWDAVDAAASGAAGLFAGRSSVSERQRAGRTALLPPSQKLRRTGTKPGEASWRRRVAYGKTVWS